MTEERVQRRLVAVLVAAILALLVGCEREQPVYNVRDHAMPANLGALGLEEIENRIVDATAAAQWQAKPIRPGVLLATTRWARHVAVVKILFNKKTYSIRYEPSENLLYGEGYTPSSYTAPAVIHRNYNKRVQQLEFETERRLY